jgi:putative zinc finger/helix-turn-helix YgiT family protein
LRALGTCPACGAAEVREEIGKHHFTESGLRNVWITNVRFAVCEKCGERTLRLPNPIGLMTCIGEGVILTPGPLSEKEIKFLRKCLFLKSGEFANLIGVSRATVSRWEHGETSPDTSNDRLTRLTYANKVGLQERAIAELLERFQREDAAKKPAKSDLDYFFPLPEQRTPYQCNMAH